MKFFVYKASGYRNNFTEKPCKNAVLECEEKTKSKENYSIEIATIEELVKFIENNNDIIIEKRPSNSSLYLTIYDDYVE